MGRSFVCFSVNSSDWGGVLTECFTWCKGESTVALRKWLGG